MAGARTISLLDVGRGILDRLVWLAARRAVDAVRYQPPHAKLLLACGASQPEVSDRVAHWLAEAPATPAARTAARLPHLFVRAIAARAAGWFGPTASAAVRFVSGAAAAAADQLAVVLERPLRARAHPGLLVPHPHDVAVLALDMRGFSVLTLALDDTQYLADLIEDYLSELTAVVEQHRGVVIQYTGDGLIALFLPELAGRSHAALLDGLVHDTCPALHRAFDALYARWQEDWQASGRATVPIGLGVGVSFGRVTMGFMGPSGKKQFGAIGEAVNLAAFLCAEAEAGTLLIDHDSFIRAGFEPLRTKVVRLRSRKLRRRVDAVSVRCSARRKTAPGG